MAGARAHRAAEALASRAMEHDCVILVGHRFFNRLIARELKQGGWTASRRIGRGFGAYTVFVRDIRGDHCIMIRSGAAELARASFSRGPLHLPEAVDRETGTTRLPSATARV